MIYDSSNLQGLEIPKPSGTDFRSFLGSLHCPEPSASHSLWHRPVVVSLLPSISQECTTHFLDKFLFIVRHPWIPSIWQIFQEKPKIQGSWQRHVTSLSPTPPFSCFSPFLFAYLVLDLSILDPVYWIPSWHWQGVATPKLFLRLSYVTVSR